MNGCFSWIIKVFIFEHLFIQFSKTDKDNN